MNNDTNAAVEVSVLLATRNRAQQLSETLMSYKALDTAGLHWQLIVVDNGSSDETADVLCAAANELPLIHLHCAKPGKARALNYGLDHALGGLIVFTDDDILPDRDYLKAIVSGTLRWPKQAVFGGRIEALFPPGTPAWLCSPEFSLARVAFARYRPAEREQIVDTAPFGGSFAVQAAALGTLRFDTRIGPRPGPYAMGDETQLLARLARRGWGFVYLHEAVVQHVIRPEQTTERWLLQRAFNAGLSRGRNQRSSGKGPPMSEATLAYETIRLGLKYQVQRMFADEQSRLRTGVRWQQARGELQARKDMSHPGE